MAIPEQYRRIIGAMHRLELLRRISIRDSARGIELHRTQMPMLEYIAAHDGCAQADVSKHLHVSPASVACSAKRMESAGLIARTADETCAATNFPRPKKGMRASRRCAPCLMRWMHAHSGGFPMRSWTRFPACWIGWS